MPLRARIALFGSGVVALAVLAFGVLLYLLAAVSAPRQQAAELTRRANEAAASLQRAAPTDVAAQRTLIPVDLAVSTDVFVEVLAPSGALLFSTGARDGTPPQVTDALLAEARTQGTAAGLLQAGTDAETRVYVRMWESDGAPAGFVVAGQPTRVVRTNLRGLRGFILLAAFVSLFGALGASWWVAGRGLRPLKAMANTADEIGQTQNFARRLPQQKGKDEIGLLTISFNQMLERLHAAHQRLFGSLEAQQRFVADASHELRSPLTTIRANAGLLLQRADVSEADRAEALRDIASEADRMTALVGQLLALARADAGQHQELSVLDLGLLIDDVCQKATKLHPVPAIAATIAPHCLLDGNDQSLRQMLWILLDNAVKYTGDGGHIWMRLTTSDARAHLTVADDGQGIPADALERVFDRFYRADPSRAGDGTGLGLAIARWIVQEHHGEIRARNNDTGGATFEVELPLKEPGGEG